MAQVGLVTPLRDGMNLVAKEYVAAQDPENPGVLVLSRFAGAAEGMTEALLVNPLDAVGVAEAMNAALTMPLDERRERHAAMFRRLQAHSVTGWAKSFLDALERPDTTETTHSRAAALSVFQPRVLARSASTSSDSSSEDSFVSQVADLSTARAKRLL
jgi:trehalose 6-phosphate synthase